MKTSEVLQAWATILSGRAPSLSIELTRECPLRCPGCYAYEEETGEYLFYCGWLTAIKRILVMDSKAEAGQELPVKATRRSRC